MGLYDRAPEFVIIDGDYYLPDRLAYLGRNCQVRSVGLHEMGRRLVAQADQHAAVVYIAMGLETAVKYLCPCLGDAYRPPPITHLRRCPECVAEEGALEARLLRESA